MLMPTKEDVEISSKKLKEDFEKLYIDFKNLCLKYVSLKNFK